MHDKVLNWGMSPGMGDVMNALNCAYRWAEEFDSSLLLNLHWPHDKDHKHHPEDPETIIERTDYIKDFYIPSNVEVNHITPGNPKYQLKEYRFDWFKPRKHRHVNSWGFKPETYLPTQENKIVIWRPIFNAETPRFWKRSIPNSEWELLINYFKTIGYEIVELCYRTPISEVTYHINTCDFIICYDGMWHYIAKNFYKPMFIASIDKITKYHTRHARKLGPDKFYSTIGNMDTEVYFKYWDVWETPYNNIHRQAQEHKLDFLEWYNGNR